MIVHRFKIGGSACGKMVGSPSQWPKSHIENSASSVEDLERDNPYSDCQHLCYDCWKDIPVRSSVARKLAHEARRRCSHDGETCHHQCEKGQCLRKLTGSTLAKPRPGYPLPGHGPEGWEDDPFDLEKVML